MICYKKNLLQLSVEMEEIFKADASLNLPDSHSLKQTGMGLISVG